MWTKLKTLTKKAITVLANPRLVLCFSIAWMITNGWAYILFGLSLYFGINWLLTVTGVYLTWLWFPFSPEKLVTLAVSIKIMRKIFPNDTKTLAALDRLKAKVKSAIDSRKEKRMQKCLERKMAADCELIYELKTKEPIK